MPDRREILTILGCVGLGAPVVAAEALDTFQADMHDTPGRMMGMSGPGLMSRSREAQNKFVSILENAAAAIRRGELCAVEMNVNSTVKFDDWMQHEVKFTFELYAPHFPDC